MPGPVMPNLSSYSKPMWLTSARSQLCCSNRMPQSRKLLHNTNLSFTVLEAGQSEIQAPAGQCLLKTCSVCLFFAETQCLLIAFSHGNYHHSMNKSVPKGSSSHQHHLEGHKHSDQICFCIWQQEANLSLYRWCLFTRAERYTKKEDFIDAFPSCLRPALPA